MQPTVGPFPSTVRMTLRTLNRRRRPGAAEYSPSQEAVRRQHPKYSFADNVQAMMAGDTRGTLW